MCVFNIQITVPRFWFLGFGPNFLNNQSRTTKPFSSDFFRLFWRWLRRRKWAKILKKPDISVTLFYRPRFNWDLHSLFGLKFHGRAPGYHSLIFTPIWFELGPMSQSFKVSVRNGNNLIIPRFDTRNFPAIKFTSPYLIPTSLMPSSIVNKI